MFIDKEIKIGQHVLGETDGVTITVFDDVDLHPCPYWGKNSGERFALAKMKGKIIIQNDSSARRALQEFRSQELKEAGRTDGDYIYFFIRALALSRSFILKESSWRFDEKGNATTYDLF